MDGLVQIVAAALAGAALGWWLAGRGFTRGIRELEAYLEGWADAKQERDREHIVRVHALRRRRRLGTLVGKLEERRREFGELHSLSETTRRRLQQLIDLITETVLVYDPEGRLLFASVEVREIVARATGRTETDPEGADAPTVSEVAAFLAECSNLDEVVREMLETGREPSGREPSGREVALRVGEEQWRFFATPHRMRAERDSTLLGLLVLLTALEVVEEMRRSGIRSVALEHARLAAELLAHRIRNPLNSIVLVVEVLRRESARAADARVARNLDTIQSEVARLEIRLQRFLEVLRRREPRPESVDLVSVIEGVSELLYPVARDAGVRVRQELHVASARVHGDAVELTRALLAPALAALRGAPAGAELKFQLDSEHHENLVFFEGPALPPGSIELGVAQELAARNGGTLEPNDPERPARLAYRFRTNA